MPKQSLTSILGSNQLFVSVADIKKEETVVVPSMLEMNLVYLIKP